MYPFETCGTSAEVQDQFGRRPMTCVDNSVNWIMVHQLKSSSNGSWLCFYVL